MLHIHQCAEITCGTNTVTIIDAITDITHIHTLKRNPTTYIDKKTYHTHNYKWDIDGSDSEYEQSFATRY